MNVKSTLLGALASFAVVGAAAAADLPNRKEAVYAPPPPFDWTGGHMGVNGGWGGGSVNTTSTNLGFPFGANPGFLTTTNSAISTSGGFVGVQDGYLWQFSNKVVVGYEHDFQYANISGSDNSLGFGGVGVRQRIEWFGTERLRFGYAMGRFLPYFTGGLIYGQVRANGQQFVGGYIFPTATSAWRRAGWTVGAGLEYALWDRVSVKAEYLYSEMPGASTSGGGVGPNPFGLGYQTYQSRALSTHIARVGVNYNLVNISTLLGLVGVHF
jgi:outer membrane immunogenic protein